METEVRYYRRRACEEMSAAVRAVTPAARERRLYLVNLYVERLKAMNVPSPFEQDIAKAMPNKSAFGWRAGAD